MRRIADMPKLDRPREKLQVKGAKALSDLELLAVLLGTGTKEQDVLAVAEKVLKAVNKGHEKLEVSELQEIEGVGPVKASIIAAALEFARRRIKSEGIKISFPADVLPLLMHLADQKQEHFVCISLNGANEVIATRVVSVGLATKTQVHPREVFADPLTDRAAAVIIAHNHTIESITPSKEDIEITKRLKDAGDILGIRLMDHVIFNRKGYHSFLEHGEI